MQKSCTFFAVMLVLTLVALLGGAGFGLDASGSSPLVSMAAAQDIPGQDVPDQNAPVPSPPMQTPPQAEPATGSSSQALNVIGIILLTLVLPYFAGIGFAKWIRLPDLGRKMGVVFASLVCSITIVVLLWPPQFGIDLQGGVILVYEVDEQASLDMMATDTTEEGGTGGFGQSREQRLMEGTAELITQLQKRINPSGVSEVVIRPYGQNQVEVIVPQAEAADIDSIKRLITRAGILEFMIVANRHDHDFLMTRAQDESQLGATFVTDRNGRRIGRWVRVGADATSAVGEPSPTNPGIEPYINSQQHMVRGGGDGLPFEVLMRMEDANNRLGGSHLSQASVTRDERGQPAVAFGFNPDGAQRMGRLSQENLTEPNISRQLGIVMDNVLMSAPQIRRVITDSGIITGRFTQEEVTQLTQILRSGRLPVVLRKEPISEQSISATLGDDTIRKGQIAITISMIAVLVFMLLYYRVAGIVACFALLFNLVLILAVMIAISADLTLPGIAGLVLTVGMAVDANVLIYERIREELNGGASLRVALSNGFNKAMSTIVDANITTLITAAVLYRIGTDQVRGFAVTLIVGILMSMFTAIYVSRGIFDILEKKRLIKSLHMMPSVSSIGVDFIGKRKAAGIASVALILIGMVAVGSRGRDIFDIDFNGGASVQVYLKEPMPISEVRAALTGVLPDLSVSEVTLEGQENRIYKVDTSLAEYGQLGRVLLTDRSGKSAEVDLTGLDSLSQIIQTLDQAEVGITVALSNEGDGMVFEDETDGEGSMSIRNADDGTNTADQLRMNFSTDEMRYITGRIPAGVDVVQRKIAQVFTTPEGESLLVMHNMDFDPPQAATTPGRASPEAGAVPQTTPTTTEASSEPNAPPLEDELPLDSPRPTDDQQSLLAPVMPRVFALLPWNVPLNLLLQEEGDTPPPMSEAADEQQPVEDEPMPDEPTPEEPMPEQPMPEQPMPEQPMPEQPMSEQPMSEQPMSEQPMPEQPMPEEPMSEEPMSEEPMSEEPLVPLQDPTGVQVPGGDVAPVVEPPRFQSQTQMVFDESISADTVRNLINQAAEGLSLPRPEIALLDSEGRPLPSDSRVSQRSWQIQLSSAPAEAEQILSRVSARLESTPVWPSSSKIGGKVAGDMRTMAITAVIFCLIGIIGYIWFRFQSIAFGIAAVVALAHDVLVMLAFIGLSTYLAPALGFLQVTEFKISLTVVAAFLAIIGYSINDTIVIFDRIREVRGKSPDLTSEMINFSVNQTLGRTLLTSVTTLMVALILYFIGGEGIHSFAFCLVVGIIAGTYSSIFVACPVLLYLMNRNKGVQKAHT